MSEPIDPLIVELLSWLSVRRRTYAETMEAWRTSCPRHSTWEDALAAGLIRVQTRAGEVELTSGGHAILHSDGTGRGRASI